MATAGADINSIEIKITPLLNRFVITIDRRSLCSGRIHYKITLVLCLQVGVRCVTSDKGPSTMWLSTWLSTCRASNPDLCKRGKWVIIKSHTSELRGYKESRIAALTHTHSRREIAHNLKFHLWFFSDPKIDNTYLNRQDILHEGRRR